MCIVNYLVILVIPLAMAVLVVEGILEFTLWVFVKIPKDLIWSFVSSHPKRSWFFIADSNPAGLTKLD